MGTRATITCVYCGKTFATDMPTTGSGIGSYGAQHGGPGGCHKTTRVYYRNGQVERTDTK
jgi:hypothetical protein